MNRDFVETLSALSEAGPGSSSPAPTRSTPMASRGPPPSSNRPPDLDIRHPLRKGVALRMIVEIEGVSVPILGREEFIANKKTVRAAVPERHRSAREALTRRLKVPPHTRNLARIIHEESCEHGNLPWMCDSLKLLQRLCGSETLTSPLFLRCRESPDEVYLPQGPRSRCHEIRTQCPLSDQER
jgi:hypothetical protein